MTLPHMTTRAALALAEENEAERLRLYQLLPRFPDVAFTEGNPETEDNLRGILCHVTFAIFSYSCWMRRVLSRLDPGVEKSMKAAFLERVRGCATATAFTEASEWAATHYYDSLGEIGAEELSREFTTNWGETMAVETMMEHALVHLMRHRRQLEILLGMRPRGALRGEPETSA